MHKRLKQHKSHYMITLHQLNWLLIQWHIKFQLASLTFNAMHILKQKPHFTSLIFLFLTILSMVLRHLPPLTSYKFFVLILFSVLTLSRSCPNYFKLRS